MIVTALGAMMAIGGLGGALLTRKKEKPKDKMMMCFDRARLYIKQKSDDGQDVLVYPGVTQTVRHSDHDAYHFTLPIGVNPSRVYKYLWVFKQGFGDYVDLEGESAHFILRAFRGPILHYDYEYDPEQLSGCKLPILVGKSRRAPVVYDMVENPHLLIAGETGSGKSTGLRAILTTLILRFSPEKLQLYLGDLKRTEFHLFKRLPHVQQTVIETRDALEMMEEISAIMDERGRILDAHEVAHINDAPCDLPYIIVAIDEFAELKKEKKALEIMERVGALGRALGVYLILSTQRPDSDIVNGRLKMNLTVRLAFRHADGINSRITIGQDGAENIKQSEKGRGLLKLDGLTEVQSPYLSLEKARELLQ